jgi:hypothetical protein
LEEKEYLDTIYKGLRSLELYGIGNMQRETQGLLAQCTSGEFPEMTKYFLGKPDGQYPPGDIDFFKAIIIADLGTDSPPIALDYRKDKNDPSVMILHICRRDNEFVTRWLKIADTFEEFWDAIKVKR